MDFIPPEIDLRKNLIRALSEPWGRPADIAKLGASLLKHSGATSECINRVASAWSGRLTPQELFTPGEFAQICDDELLRCLLKSTFICDIELERFLTATRCTLLQSSAEVNAANLGEDGLRFCCALAHQCFINEYIFGYTDDELEQAHQLRTQVVQSLVSENSVPELWFVIVAMYFPLASLPMAQLILDRSWSDPVSELVLRQVQEWQEEQHLRPCIRRLTPVNDRVSRAVQQQYEENPYPRWVMAAPVAIATTIDGYLRRRFPLVPFRRMEKRAVDILIAGCGTGQHSIETAQQFIGAQVLAIDLSLASLCYAKRKTRELELSNIDYAQADILHLEAIGRDFDVIDASGVLHHLADPLSGWRMLRSMLRPGGFMRVGLYSKLARRNIVDARTIIAQRGYRASPEDMRQCRQLVATLADARPARRVTEMSDFFSMSTCRDLLFHVQEHQFTLPEIGVFLKQNRLQLLGFEIHGQVLQSYRARFPDDQTMTDLNSWHSYEKQNPAIFAGMYQFWIQDTS